MATKPPLLKFLEGFLHTDNKRKQNCERTGSIKHRRRKDKYSVSSIESSAHIQSLRQQKQVNGRIHNIPININSEYEWTQLLHQKTPFTNWIKKNDLTSFC
jgi:hypothetical protein